MISRWFFVQKYFLIVAALASAFSPLYSAAEVLPAQLSDQKYYGPIAELDHLAFKNQTVATDSLGNPYVTTLGLALRSYALDTYRSDETIVDEGVIKNICLYSHVVNELSEKARLQAGRASFARETLTLKKKPALLKKQATINAFDAPFKQETQNILSSFAQDEKIFLEVATQQHELSPIDIDLTRILGPLNWAIIPLMLLAHAKSISQPEASVLSVDAINDREKLRDIAKDNELTIYDQIKLGLNHCLFKDSRPAALVGTVTIPLIGGLILALLENDINRWGHENISALKKNHLVYSLLYQITEGLQFAGDAARFAMFFMIINPSSMPKTLSWLFDPAAARNGSIITSRWLVGAERWKASGKLIRLIEKEEKLKADLKGFQQKLRYAQILGKPDAIERAQESISRIRGADGNSGELRTIATAIAEEKKRVKEALTTITNNYFAQEHKIYITTLEKIQAQLAREEHILELKKGVIASCRNILKAAQMADLRANKKSLFESFCDPLANASEDDQKAAISIDANKLNLHIGTLFDEVITEFKQKAVEVCALDDDRQKLSSPSQAPSSIASRPQLAENVATIWKDIIRAVLSKEFTAQETIARGGTQLTMEKHTVDNFYTDSETMADETCVQSFYNQAHDAEATLTDNQKILRKISLKGASETSAFNYFGFNQKQYKIGSQKNNIFNNPVGAAAYNYLLRHKTDGLFTSPAIYWMIRGIQNAIAPVISSITPASWSAKNILSWRQKNSDIQPTRKLLVSFSHYVRGATSLYQHIAQNKELMSNLPPHIISYFEQFFGENAHPELAEIVSLSGHRAFDKAEGFLWHIGALGRLIDLVNQHMPRFQELSQAVGYIDYLTILSDMVAPESAVINDDGQTIQWCFPSLIETEKPYINFSGMWYPGYKPTKVISTAVSLGGENNAQHLIITGVNGCGKSIVMSAMMSVVVFAHTHGIAPAQAATLCPFDLVMFHGNIDDAKIDGYSKGIAEILHSGIVLKKIVQQMNKEGQKLRAYITMDELFCSTDQETATTLAKVILDVIMQDPQAMLIFTTHNKELTSLEKETHGKVKNAYVDTDIDVTQEKVIYKRQLCEGINKLSPALFIMKERFKESGLQDPFVLGILDKAIAYQKAQKGFGKQVTA